MTKIGFIGLGSQGAPMARRIVESGYPLVLWARRAEALAPFADTAAETASSIADLGARAEHVGVSVSSTMPASSKCAKSSSRRCAPGGRIAIHSTVHPNTVMALAKRAAARGLALLDAPVSGGGPAAAARTLTVMVGGDEERRGRRAPHFRNIRRPHRARGRRRRRPDGEARQQRIDGRTSRDGSLWIGRRLRRSVSTGPRSARS